MVFSKEDLKRDIDDEKVISWCLRLFSKLESVGISCSVPTDTQLNQYPKKTEVHVSVSMDKKIPFYLRLRFDTVHDVFCYGLGDFGDKGLRYELRWTLLTPDVDVFNSIAVNVKYFVPRAQPTDSSYSITPTHPSIQHTLARIEELLESIPQEVAELKTLYQKIVDLIPRNQK